MMSDSFSGSLFLYFCAHQVAISLAKILLQVTRPRTALLGNLPGTTIYRNIEQYPEAIKVPGVLIVRVDSAIYFSNSNYVKERYALAIYVYIFNSIIGYHYIHETQLVFSAEY